MVNTTYLYYTDAPPLIGCLDNNGLLVVFIDYVHSGYFCTGMKATVAIIGINRW